MRLPHKLGATFIVLALVGFAGAQSWTRVTPTSTPFASLGAMLLLTDGTVMVQDLNNPSHWYKLTPDAAGSYVNGTWRPATSMPAGYGPLYFGSSVIPDGRLLVEGGEYNFGVAVWTNKGAIYDPVADSWTPVNPPPGWGAIGDAQQVILADGRIMQASCCDFPRHLAYFDPKTLTWTPTDILNSKFDAYDEEGFTLLPDGNILTVDTYVGVAGSGTNAELYNPATGMWSLTASTPTQLWAGNEIGPAVLRPDGTVFQTGAAPVTAIYDAKTSQWTEGPDFPDGLGIPDGPAALETNGNVLMMASGASPGSTFLEWDGVNLTPIAGPPNAIRDSSYYGHMLELPTGQILFTDFSNDVEVFTPKAATGKERAEDDEGQKSNWTPKVLFSPVVVAKGGTYQVSGYRFAGMSQGAAYGDDYQSSTNYALVRLTNVESGHVFYARTHDPSSYAVQSQDIQKTYFDVPANMDLGVAKMEVVTNGLASQARVIVVRAK
jgi:hypothetical protein